MDNIEKTTSIPQMIEIVHEIRNSLKALLNIKTNEEFQNILHSENTDEIMQKLSLECLVKLMELKTNEEFLNFIQSENSDMIIKKTIIDKYNACHNIFDFRKFLIEHLEANGKITKINNISDMSSCAVYYTIFNEMTNEQLHELKKSVLLHEINTWYQLVVKNKLAIIIILSDDEMIDELNIIVDTIEKLQHNIIPKQENLRKIFIDMSNEKLFDLLMQNYVIFEKKYKRYNVLEKEEEYFDNVFDDCDCILESMIVDYDIFEIKNIFV
ncbi:hypothetical protein BMW23_0833 [Bodo saltans virus]|uniref:Uncharacterized protein n=1 Tax=Bodo saltans virus TaxID=2024608 RepID=A0A2H4UVJ1_9VIRU|nr:hypothetical protein QJ851_gp0816 [Bodo saltans virus]ATZ80879.1 hypothetical protein BMW23_0833 [Bodo saltans virus]